MPVQVLATAVRQEQGCTVWRSHLDDLMDHVLCHRQRAITHINGQQQCALRVHSGPDPLGRTLQTLDGLRLTDLAGLHRAKQGKEFVQLHLPDPYIMQDGLGKRPQLLCRFN